MCGMSLPATQVTLTQVLILLSPTSPAAHAAWEVDTLCQQICRRINNVLHVADEGLNAAKASYAIGCHRFRYV